MNKRLRIFQILLALGVIAVPVIASTGGFNGVSTALLTVCSGIRQLLPIVAFLLIVAAGVVYAAGQMLGAETRARASVWATAMIIGAIIGILIVVVAPVLINAMMPSGTTGLTTC